MIISNWTLLNITGITGGATYKWNDQHLECVHWHWTKQDHDVYGNRFTSEYNKVIRKRKQLPPSDRKRLRQ
ncbi:MAG: hypothetical protein IPL23_30535 [Saprospiraceae bacterium]|nr:hypothetical protein [Saprospiraceae bacterium]